MRHLQSEQDLSLYYAMIPATHTWLAIESHCVFQDHQIIKLNIFMKSAKINNVIKFFLLGNSCHREFRHKRFQEKYVIDINNASL